MVDQKKPGWKCHGCEGLQGKIQWKKKAEAGVGVVDSSALPLPFNAHTISPFVSTEAQAGHWVDSARVGIEEWWLIDNKGATFVGSSAWRNA